MDAEKLLSLSKEYLKKWWASLLILPFAIYSVHQIYWALNFNIFFAVNYDYPFPLNILYFFIDSFLLIVHEAGHTFFGIIGVRFITILGGSLLQILIPGFILGYFWINRQYLGIQFSLSLVGFSWLDIAGYAADAGARELPLIGGLGKESHDWYNLLAQIDALEYDLYFALIFTSLGIACYLWALLMPINRNDYQEVDLKLNLE